MNLDGVNAHTWGLANFQSGGNLTTSGKVNHWRVDNRPSAGSSFNGWYQDHEWVNYTSLTGNEGITLGAMGGHLRINGTNVSGGNGTATLQALGHVRLETVMTDIVQNATSTGWRENCFLFVCQKTTWTTHHDRAWRNVNAASVNARNISIKAGNNVETYATRLNASNNLKIEAGDQALYYAVKNETDHKDTTEKKKSFIGIRYDKSTEHSTSRINTPMVTHLYARDGNLTSYSGGDQLYQGTTAISLTRDIRAGVGEKARADARIILEGVKTTVQQSRTAKSNYVVWQSQSGSGGLTETMALPSFAGGGTFTAPGGISVQIPEGDFKSQITSLSSQPGMGYLNDLAARKDVNWQAVKLAHDQWSYSQSGLTPAGALLIGLAVAAATGGAGVSLLGSTSTAATTLAGVTTTTTVTTLGTTTLAVNGVATVAGAMVNGAFLSLTTQASITLINNKGDVGKTLKELGNSNTVKNMIIAAGVAGVATYTADWGRTVLTETGNTVVTDWAKRSQAYMLNTAAKGVLTGANSSSDWWTVAGLGLAGEAYQYWAGRGADVRPGVDRSNPQFDSNEEGGLYRVPRETVDGVLREGKNIGLNENPCVSMTRICHGMPISNGLNTLPGFNAFATLHDGWGEWLAQNKNWNVATNLGSMPPALLVNYGALLDQYRYVNAKRK
jgi:filamentous hemagglutinin